MKKKIFYCKNIYTVASEELIDGCIVVEGEKIVFVGSREEGKAYEATGGAGETEIFDFDDKFIMPSFHDFHIHLLFGAMMAHDGLLRYAASADEAAKLLYDSCKDKKDQEWILGGAWDHFRWEGQKLPDKTSLDKYFPDQKVFSLNKECHSAWANSRTLEFFNITKDTPDPPDGYYGRDENGEPNGFLHEKACLDILDYIFKNLSDRQAAEFVKSYAKTANAFGITAVSDLPIGLSVREKAYKQLEDSDRLTMRINFSKPMMTDLKELLEIKETYKDGLVRFIGVKDFVDGTPMGHSGYMLEPYTDMPGFRSSPMIEPDLLNAKVKEMTENNIKVRLHACGDGAVRICFDALEAAKKDLNLSDFSSPNLRHCLEHLESTTPEDIAKFAPLGVIASVQPEHMPKYGFAGHPFHTMIGPERMKYSWPFESINKTGAVLAYGTDFPVVDMNPYRGIYRSVTRLTNEGEPEGGFNPTERVSIHDTLKAYTYGPAYAAGREAELGTLEEGKLADIVILDENLFDCARDREAMFEISPVMTLMSGQIVYRK